MPNDNLSRAPVLYQDMTIPGQDWCKLELGAEPLSGGGLRLYLRATILPPNGRWPLEERLPPTVIAELHLLAEAPGYRRASEAARILLTYAETGSVHTAVAGTGCDAEWVHRVTHRVGELGARYLTWLYSRKSSRYPGPIPEDVRIGMPILVPEWADPD